MGAWPVWVSSSGLNLYALSARMVLISRFCWRASSPSISAKGFPGPPTLSSKVPGGGGCASLKNCSCGRSLRNPVEWALVSVVQVELVVGDHSDSINDFAFHNQVLCARCC